MSEWGRVIHFQTFKVRLRDRFKYWLRWRFKWLLRVMADKARGLAHGRIRCIVLGHDHSIPAFEGTIYWVPSIESPSDRAQLAQDLNAGVDITEFVKGVTFSPREGEPPPFYLDDSVFDDAFDDVHGEWPGDLKYWRWDEQGDGDVAT